MTTFPILMSALVAFVVILGVVLLAIPRRRALVAVDAEAFPGLSRLRRSTLRARAVSMVTGLAVALFVINLNVGLVPIVFAAVQIVGVLVTDALERDAARTPGSAGIEVRRVRDFVPKVLLGLALSTAAGLYVVLSVAAREPIWPGSYYSSYSRPLATGLTGLLVLAVVAAVVIVRRPRNGSDPEIVRVDDAIRRRSFESVVTSVGLALSVILAASGGMLLYGIASNERYVGDLYPAGVGTLGWFFGLAGSIWFLIVLLLPGASAGKRTERRSFAAWARS